MTTKKKHQYNVICSAMLLGVFDYAQRHNVDLAATVLNMLVQIEETGDITLGDPNDSETISTSPDQIKRKR